MDGAIEYTSVPTITLKELDIKEPSQTSNYSLRSTDKLNLLNITKHLTLLITPVRTQAISNRPTSLPSLYQTDQNPPVPGTTPCRAHVRPSRQSAETPNQW